MPQQNQQRMIRAQGNPQMMGPQGGQINPRMQMQNQINMQQQMQQFHQMSKNFCIN